MQYGLLLLLVHNPAIQLCDEFLQLRRTVGNLFLGIVKASIEDIVEDIGLENVCGLGRLSA